MFRNVLSVSNGVLIGVVHAVYLESQSVVQLVRDWTKVTHCVTIGNSFCNTKRIGKPLDDDTNQNMGEMVHKWSMVYTKWENGK